MTDDDVVDRLRFLSAAQHEANTPLAVIRGWADTFATMWDELGDADRQRGTASIQRHVTALTELLDALFVALRAEALTHGRPGGSAELAEVVAQAVDQLSDVHVEDDIPAATVAVEPAALELLIGAAAVGLGYRTGSSVAVSVEQHPDGPTIIASPTAAEGAVAGDAFDPFPGGDPSPSGIRLYAARRLATALGGSMEVRADGRLRLRLPRS